MSEGKSNYTTKKDAKMDYKQNINSSLLIHFKLYKIYV